MARLKKSTKTKDEPHIEIEESPNLWEKQPWDTAISYEAFVYAYLDQPPPRRVAAAYVRWQEKCGRKVVRLAYNRISVPIHFYDWVHGRDTQGQKPVGSVFEHSKTWAERAAAFDEDVYRKRLAAIRTKQAALRDKEYEAGDTLLDRALGMMAMRPNPTEFDEADVNKHIDMAFKLMRRALQMPTDSKEVMVKQWREALTDAGLDPDTVFEETVNALVEQLEASDPE
ncbi:MAG: hypothetical protein IPK79_00055 [Vampirovibrionales bacterium]|nr:hypothetical protein [Vampirovibrionales bacterium]